MTRIPAGQRRRSSSPVTSATSAPSRISPSEVTAGVHTRSGIVMMALINAVFLVGKPTEYSNPPAADLNGASQPVQQLMGGAGPVGPDQQPPPKRRRDLGDGPGQDVDVVPGVITAGVARPQ